MTEFEVFFWVLFSLGVTVTFVVMLVRRPGEKSRETFDKRDW
jgi:hypothetical protein